MILINAILFVIAIWTAFQRNIFLNFSLYSYKAASINLT